MYTIVLFSACVAVSWAVVAFAVPGGLLAKSWGKNNFLCFLLISLPPLAMGLYFVGLRPFDAGGDTIAYLQGFSRLGSVLSAASDAGYGSEISFWPVQAFLKMFLDARGWFVAHFLIISFLVYVAYKELLRDSPISPLIFSSVFLTFFVLYSGNTMRQAYAMPLGLMAFFLYFKGNTKASLLMLAAAVSFHWSALIILAAPFVRFVPYRRRYYLLSLMGLLILGFLSADLVNILVSLFQFEWMVQKSGLYIEGLRESHIEAVWKTVNFWLCLSVFLCAVMSKMFYKPENKNLFGYLFFFQCLMIFFVRQVDISERYMAYFLLALPAVVFLLIHSLKLPGWCKDALAITVFSLGAIAVYSRESAMITLGIPF